MATGDGGHCADKTRLFAEYNRSVNEWSKAVQSLSGHAGNADFALLMSVVDEARAKTHGKKAAHIAEHGC